MQSNDSHSENAALKERAAKDTDQQSGQHNTAPQQNKTSPGTTSNETKSRFERFASTQAAGDGVEGDVLKPDKTIEERLGANMADRK